MLVGQLWWKLTSSKMPAQQPFRSSSTHQQSSRNLFALVRIDQHYLQIQFITHEFDGTSKIGIIGQYYGLLVRSGESVDQEAGSQIDVGALFF